jgi:hypothetical protein
VDISRKGTKKSQSILNLARHEITALEQIGMPHEVEGHGPVRVRILQLRFGISRV